MLRFFPVLIYSLTKLSYFSVARTTYFKDLWNVKDTFSVDDDTRGKIIKDSCVCFWLNILYCTINVG